MPGFPFCLVSSSLGLICEEEKVTVQTQIGIIKLEPLQVEQEFKLHELWRTKLYYLWVAVSKFKLETKTITIRPKTAPNSLPIQKQRSQSGDPTDWKPNVTLIQPGLQ